MKGVVDFFLGLVVLLVGVVLLFLAFLNVRDQQSSLPEVIRQSQVTASLASAQDSGNTSLAQCGPSADQQGVAEALYSTFSQAWGTEDLLVVVGRGGAENSENWTLYCGPGNNDCGVGSEQVEVEVAGCLRELGQTSDECCWYFLNSLDTAFGPICNYFPYDQFVREGGDGPPQNPGCNHHEDCEPRQYCYAGSCYDCPDGYKRRGVTLQQGMFWFLRNFRLAYIYELFFGSLQADSNSLGLGGTGGGQGNQGGNQNTEGNENQDGYDHPFCEPCSEQESGQCGPQGPGSQTDLR